MKKAFTLIELLVVIAIIGVLTAIVMASLNGARQNSRDGKRLSDIAQLQLALESYFDLCRVYPNATDEALNGGTTKYLNANTNNASSGTCAQNFGTFVASIPVPPPQGVKQYYYEVQSSGKSYCLAAVLENTTNSNIQTQCTFSTAIAGNGTNYNTVAGAHRVRP